MAFTIAQLADFADGAQLPGSVQGTVKTAMDPKEHPEYGTSQFFVLSDATGEVGCYLGNKEGVPFSPMRKGDQVEIFTTTNGKGQLGGVKKGTYQGKPQLKVYSNAHVRNLSAPAATQTQAYAPATGTTGQQVAPSHATAASRPTGAVATAGNGKLTEGQARELLLRNYDVFAEALGLDRPEGPVPALVTMAGAWATSILIATTRGDILPDPKPSAHPKDPEWMEDEPPPERDWPG